MKLKNTLFAGLIISGASLLAGEPTSLIKNDLGNEFLKSNPELSFRKKSEEKQAFKLNKSAAFSGKDWDEAEVTGSGLFINFGINIPSANFLDPYDAIDQKYKLGFDFELGSFFRFAKIQDGKMGIGLRVTWLSLTYNSMTYLDDKYRVAQIKPLHLGPQFSLAIDDKMGVDIFYQIGYNLTDNFVAYDDPTNSKDVGGSYAYHGVSHEIGAAFHYKVFSLGLGYRFGKLKNFLNYYDGEQLDSDFLDDKKASVNNFRITLGFRF